MANSSSSSKNNNPSTTIQDIRAGIDAIDVEMARLLAARWQLVAQISKLKKLTKEEAGYRPFREQQIHDKLPDDRVVPRVDYWSIWKEIMTTTVMRENPFHIAVDKDFLMKEGLRLGQEFGRRSQWQLLAGHDVVLNQLVQRAAGLAVIPTSAAREWLAVSSPSPSPLAIVNIFPSFHFDGRTAITADDVVGIIVAWERNELPSDTPRLFIKLSDDEQTLIVVEEDALAGRTPLGMVPKPAGWRSAAKDAMVNK